MSRRGKNRLELNFDGLTDVVTNLAAGLILLVVLTLNLTIPRQQAAQSEEQPLPGVVEERPETPEDDSGPKPIAPLLERVEQLKRQISLLDQATRDQAATLDGMRRQIEAFRSEARSAPAAAPPPPATPASPAAKTTFNLPQAPRPLPAPATRALHASPATLPLFVALSAGVFAQTPGPAAPARQNRDARRQVLQNGLSAAGTMLDQYDRSKPGLADLDTQVQQLIDELNALPPPSDRPQTKESPKTEKKSKTVTYRPPLVRSAGSRDGTWIIVCEDNRAASFDQSAANSDAQHFEWVNKLVFSVLERKSGARHAGETAEDALQPGSEFRRNLSHFNPQKTYVQFVVYPDSHEVFRAIRQEIWARGFPVQWLPLAVGQAIIGAGGSNGVQ